MDYVDHYFYTGTDIQKEKIVKKKIAFFDFDGTITTKDTLLEFIKFSKGEFKFFTGFLLNSPYIVGYKLNIISNQRAKEKVLQFFFKNTAVEVFENKCVLFYKNALSKLIKSKALIEIERLKQNGVDVVIVSASPENWIKHWAQKMQVQLLASKLEVKDGKITGKILGKNCYGNEKVRRIKEVYDLSKYSVVAAYGDTKGDKQMLAMAEKGYYKRF